MSCRFLSFSFFCNIFVCCSILSNLLCLWSPFFTPQGCSSFCFYCLPHGQQVWSRGLSRLSGGKNWYLHSGGWSWVFSLWWEEPDQVFWGVCELSTILGNLSANGWGCIPVLLLGWHEVSSTEACGQLCGARSWCWDGYLQESTSWLTFPRLRNSLVVQYCTRCSDPRCPDLTPGQGTKCPEASQCGQRKNKGRKTKTNKKNGRQAKSKTNSKN